MKKLQMAGGFSRDKRKARRQHRNLAKKLLVDGTMLNYPAPRGSIPHAVAMWHLYQARYLGR